MTIPDRAVCLYAHGAQNQRHSERGIPRYVVEHIRALHEHHRDALHSVLLNPTLPLSGNLTWLLGSGLLRWSDSVHRDHGQLPCLYHVMSPLELDAPIDQVWPFWARDPRVRTVVTLYDLIPLVYAEHHTRDPSARRLYQARLEFVRGASHVLAISESTARDAVELLGIDPRRLTVIHAGVSPKLATSYESRGAGWDALRARLGQIRPGFLFYVGGCHLRKNMDGLIAAYALLPAEVRAAHQLVISCQLLPGWAEQLEAWATAVGIAREQLVITGYVTDAELAALYRTCTLFVFPSLHEGSGLPMLEAMSCGAPVAASDTPISAEILGDREATFDPRRPASIANCIGSVIEDQAMLEHLAKRSRRRVEPYAWRAVAERTMLAYERTLSGVRTGRRRPRLALVTPWPPERSGIADYSRRIARELGRSVDVDVVVRDEVGDYEALRDPGVTLISSRSYPAARRLRQHDRVLYCMGNSHFHDYVFELLRETPGAVLFHDAQLTGFFGSYAGRERPEDPQARLIERVSTEYASRLSLTELRATQLTAPTQVSLGVFMTAEIQRHAEQLFVHSQFARDVLELDRGPGDPRVPVALLPYAMPPPRHDSSRSAPNRPPLVVHAGVLDEVKGVAVLIDAFGRFAVRHPRARLVLAGSADAAEVARWHAFARRVAPGAGIEIVGRLGTERYESLLRHADLAVQLRTVSNGEASGAVADCLAAGVPTVVTDIGWMSELPRGAVVHVPLGVEPELLARLMHELIVDAPRWLALREAALAHVRASSFEAAASEYLSALALG